MSFCQIFDLENVQVHQGARAIRERRHQDTCESQEHRTKADAQVNHQKERGSDGMV